MASVLYGIVRTLLVWRFLSDYGVRPLAFGAIELASSALYGWASARLVLAIVDRRALLRPAALTLVGYLAPDVYIFASAARFPSDLLATVVGIAVASLVISAIGLARSIRVRRRSGE